MTAAALITLAVVLMALVLMMASLAAPDLVLLGGVVLLAALGILTPAEAFEGFANEGMLTVAALFIVAAGLRETGAVSIVTAGLLGRPRTTRRALVRLVSPVLVASAFLNNTTIVASLLPAVHDWARRIGVAPSRLLMPLSFAAILGGTCTLIGTSSNLVVAGMITDLIGTRSDLHELGLFEIAPVGIPVALAGAALLVLLAPVLLPDRRLAVSRTDDPRHYTMEVLVAPGSRLAGRTIEEAGLRSLPGAFLMEIIRGDVVLPVVDASRRLVEGDRLVFVGEMDAIVDLQRTPGLTAAGDQVFKMDGDRVQRRIVEAVVSKRNPMVGYTVREGRFRTRYRAVIIAVARAGERLQGRIGNILLRPGDTLLLEAAPDFVAEQRVRTDFYLVSTVEGATPPRFERAWLALGILLFLVVVISFELAPTVVAGFVAASAMVLTRCCTLEEARRSIDLNVLVAIAASFGLGVAMQKTGLAILIADGAIAVGADTPFAALVLIYVVTSLLTELITNNAAAVLAVPLALSLADRLGAQPTGYLVAVMFAASASFLTPIGYQTNLMVFGAGGYHALDYPRLGLPLTLMTGAVTLGVIPLIWPL